MGIISAIYNNFFTSFSREGLNNIGYPISAAVAAIAVIGAVYYFKENSVDQGDIQSQRLEGLFENVCIEKLDVKSNNKLLDAFLSPNEGFPLVVKDHLRHITKPGLIVCVGTERSFFDLALSDPAKCTGLVVRDLNPKVKAYVDFNTMMLRISSDRREYVELSADIEDSSQLTERLKIIQDKVISSDIPEDIKDYYLSNLEDFAGVYFGQTKTWRTSSSFEGVKYHEDDKLFRVLQRYAKSGRIIATVGDINDLHFLDNRNVSIVDVSNIPDLIFLDLKGDNNFHPRVIWTSLGEKTMYFSYNHHSSLDSTKRAEILRLLNGWVESKKIHKDLVSSGVNNCFFREYFYNFSNFDPYNFRCADYSEESLIRMKKLDEK